MGIIGNKTCKKCGSRTFFLNELGEDSLKAVCSECRAFCGFLVPNYQSGEEGEERNRTKIEDSEN